MKTDFQQKKPIRQVCLIVLATLCGFLAFTLDVNAQPKSASKDRVFTDWKVICPKNQGCRAAQSIVLKSSQAPILQLRIYKGDNPTALFSFPLGILLSTGWRYRIDNKKSVLLPFEICNDKGCHVGVPLTKELVRALKRGNKLYVTFLDANKNEVAPTISLSGFTKAFGALP